MQRWEVNGAVRLIYRSLGVKGLRRKRMKEVSSENKLGKITNDTVTVPISALSHCF